MSSEQNLRIGAAVLVGFGTCYFGGKIVDSINKWVNREQTGTVKNIAPDQKIRMFMDVFEELKSFLLDDLKHYEVTAEFNDYVRQVLEYNVPHGKLNRGLAVIDTLLILKNYKVTDKELHDAAVLGWCIEWLQAMFLMADDLMDDSLTRRGQPCWYKLPEVELVACNDFLIVETQIYKILKHYFGKNDNFLQIVDLFKETQYQTEIGQLFDLRTQPPQNTKAGKVDLNKYTQNTYDRIVKYKTAFYSFYLPIALGLLVSGITNESTYRTAEEICVKMGVFFQVQDDYLDCYGDEAIIGKVGRDIEEAKCSWLVVQALHLSTPAQRRMLQENYGKSDPSNVAKVKNLYKELGVQQVYKNYEKDVEAELRALIGNVTGINSNIFTKLLDKIVNRQK
ncbi:farnesyl pyrophosphate synthase [Acrasis kona]|uniref:Farnesyl pyrophosphate synthase n=1 Tax=Acrasis kona TaxID=1008807 RepID=A0AAW2YGP5_9EUKA